MVMLDHHRGICKPMGALIFPIGHLLFVSVGGMGEKREASGYSKAVGDAIFGRYKAKRWNQETLAAKVGLSLGTLRRMVAGESEISARELALIAKVLGTDAQTILDEALEAYGGMDALIREAVSVVADTPVALDTKRKQNEVRTMTVEQIEDLPHAATIDPEMDTDEPE